MYSVHKAPLPPGCLGDDRCFEAKYFHHGDILAATWHGAIDFEPSHDDGVSTRFGFAHGSDAMILASLAGYLKRLGRADEEVRDVMHRAGANVLADETVLRPYHQSLARFMLQRVAHGEPLTRFDEPEEGLACLVLPVPSQPGVLENSGGTGIYTRGDGVDTILVFAEHVPAQGADGRKSTRINKKADFCPTDVPIMAELICDMALGEYRRDIRSFLDGLYVADDN